MRSVRICENHLTEFYQAIKSGNLPLMEKEERLLTPDEKCVACAYTFKTKGSVRDALEEYLLREGMTDSLAENNSSYKSEFIYWSTRLIILLLSYALVFYMLISLKNIFFQASASISIIEFILAGITALGLFIYIDDKFLD